MAAVEQVFPARLLTWAEAPRGIAVFQLALERDFVFTPGQYAVIHLTHAGETISRPYSIASSPSERRMLEFYVNLVQRGRFTPTLWQPEILRALHRRDPQTRLAISGPAGSFVLPPDEKRNLILVASGTGLAPFMSLLRQMREDSSRNPPQLCPRRVCLVHGVSYPEQLGYREELQEFAAAGSAPGGFWLVYVPTVSRPEESPSWEGLRGRAEALFEQAAKTGPSAVRTEEIIRKLLLTMTDPTTHAVMVCGHAGTVENMKHILAGRGYQPGRDLFCER